MKLKMTPFKNPTTSEPGSALWLGDIGQLYQMELRIFAFPSAPVHTSSTWSQGYGTSPMAKSRSQKRTQPSPGPGEMQHGLYLSGVCPVLTKEEWGTCKVPEVKFPLNVITKGSQAAYRGRHCLEPCVPRLFQAHPRHSGLEEEPTQHMLHWLDP